MQRTWRGLIFGRGKQTRRAAAISDVRIVDGHGISSSSVAAMITLLPSAKCEASSTEHGKNHRAPGGMCLRVVDETMTVDRTGGRSAISSRQVNGL